MAGNVTVSFVSAMNRLRARRNPGPCPRFGPDWLLGVCVTVDFVRLV